MKIALAPLFYAMVGIVVGIVYEEDDVFRCTNETEDCENLLVLFGIRQSECHMATEIKDLRENEGNFKISCCYFSNDSTPIDYSWYIDGHQVNNDEKMNETLLFTTDSFGSYLTFNETLNVEEKFKNNNLNIVCIASTSQGQRSYSTNFKSEIVCNNIYGKSDIVTHPVPTQGLEGNTVEFNCTAFSKMDDFYMKWQIKNGSMLNENISRYEIITNKDANCENIITSILRIQDVTLDDFGEEFTCVLNFKTDISKIASNPAKLMKMETEKVETENYGQGIFIALSILVLVLFTGIFAYIFRIELLLFIKDKFAALENEGVYDLFICYNSEDSERFVADFFLPSLENDYGYKCFVMERNASGGQWIPDVVSTKIREECKRFVLIMSKNVATDPTCIWACEVAVEKAISGRTHKQLISIYPADKKKELFNKMSHVESLKLICASSKKVPIVDPREKDEKKLARFWKTVCLYLPPIRSTHREEAPLPCKESYTSQYQC